MNKSAAKDEGLHSHSLLSHGHTKPGVRCFMRFLSSVSVHVNVTSYPDSKNSFKPLSNGNAEVLSLGMGGLNKNDATANTPIKQN